MFDLIEDKIIFALALDNFTLSLQASLIHTGVMTDYENLLILFYC